MGMSAKGTRRWQRIGLQEGNLREATEFLSEDFSKISQDAQDADQADEEESAYASDWDRQRELRTYYYLAETRHLEYPIPFAEIGASLDSLSQQAVNYFFGDWREKCWHVETNGYIKKSQCRKKLGWIDELRLGLWGALIARRKPDLKQLAIYVDTDLPTDEGARDRTADDNRFFIVLARLIRNGSLASSAKLISTLQKSRQRRPKMLLECLTAIADGNAEKLGSSLEKYMKFFKSMELDLNVSIVTSLEGSILWNLAEIRGLAPPKLDESLMDLIVTRESLGLK
jgi:hypothetical protein